jgi:hypothetical protein
MLSISTALGLLAGSCSASYNVSLQAHSHNDLREWRSLLTKMGGEPTFHVKVDPQYTTDAVLCSAAGVSDPRGCILLNHDDVSAARAGAYNSTADVLAFLVDPSNVDLFASPSYALKLALCFKGCGGTTCPCGGSAGATAWLSLVDDFIAAAQAAITTLGLNVELILDGAGNPGASSCLAQRWRPLRSVFISGGDPAGAFTSNNASGGWDRLSILNNEQGATWALAASLDFGKFANLSDPYQVWEPSSEADVVSAIDLFVASVSRGVEHPAGVRSALNPDPAQLAVYTARYTGRAWNDLLTTDAAAGMDRSPWPSQLTATLSLAGLPDAPVSTDHALVNVWWSGTELVWAAWGLPSGGPLGGPPLALTPATALPLPAAAAGCQLAALSAVVLVGTATTTGQVILALSSPLRSTVQLVSYALAFDATGRASLTLLPGTLNVPLPFAAGPVVSASSTAPCSTAGATTSNDLCTVVAAVPDAGQQPPRAPPCLLWLFSFCWRDTSKFCTIPVCAVTPDTPAGFSLSSSDVTSLSLATAPYALGGSIDGRHGTAVVYAARDVVYGLTACVDWEGSSQVVNDPDKCAGGPPGPIPPAGAGFYPAPAGNTSPLASYVGTDAAVSVAPLEVPGGEGSITLALLLTAGGSYCANNEPANKKNSVGLCDQLPVVPVRVAGVAPPTNAHVYGSMRAWGRQLLGWDTRPVARPPPENSTQLPLPWPGASPCSLSVATGSHGSSTRQPLPSLIVMPPGSPQAWPTVEAAVVGWGVQAGATDPHSCGAGLPQPTGTLLLQGWPLAQPFFRD